MMELNRGDVIWVNLEPARPGEQGKVRPCLVVSYDALNHSKHPGIIICPITGRENAEKAYPTQVLLPGGVCGLTKDSLIMCEQVRAIARERIVANVVPTAISPELLKKVDYALKKALGLRETLNEKKQRNNL